MRAEILAVGSELLTPQRSDTNALHLTERLRDAGVEVTMRITVADDAALLEAAFRGALERADLVISTGGLGPTEDDLTREAAAAALGRELVRDPGILERLRERFARYGRVMAPNNAKQADLIAGGRELDNPRGTAPGQMVEVDGRMLVLLPGPPREMKPLFEAEVLPRVRERLGGALLHTRVMRIASLGESDVDAALAPIYTRYPGVSTTILSQPGQVELHLTARGESREEAERAIEPLAAELRERLPGRFFSEDGRELPQVLADLLSERGETLALAESCTGGLLAERLTALPGASHFLERGFVTYSNRSKSELLGVPLDMIESRGAVSAEVAREMARGARARAGVTWAIGITGIAGPDGGTEAKPAGLVYIALAGPDAERVEERRFIGGRRRVRFQSTQMALELLRRELLGLGP